MASGALVQCTFYGNSAPLGGNIAANCGDATLDACIVAASASGVAVYLAPSSNVILTCTDIWGNAGGDWVGAIADQQGQAGNFSLDPQFCDPAGGDFRLHAESPCAPENSPDCGQIGAFGVGCGLPVAVPVAGAALRLESNYPNPFNPVTTIRFVLDAAGPARLTVLTLDGRRVATLVDAALGAGAHHTIWDGRDTHGRPVASGTYVYRLEAGGCELLGGMTLLQ